VRSRKVQTLPSAGEPWSPLVIRDVFIGINRFDDLQRDLGISRKVLAERLRHLVEAGMLERRLYSERPPRHEYVLTAMGAEC
jgi:DNA-binding HxlR family transcriptional regulator